MPSKIIGIAAGNTVGRIAGAGIPAVEQQVLDCIAASAFGGMLRKAREFGWVG
jgi:hypothetical protein